MLMLMCTVKFIHSFIHQSLQDFLVLRSQKLKTAKNQGNSATFRRVCKFTRVSTGNLIYRQTSPRKPFPTIAISPIQFPHAKKKKTHLEKGRSKIKRFSLQQVLYGLIFCQQLIGKPLLHDGHISDARYTAYDTIFTPHHPPLRLPISQVFRSVLKLS